jgi:HAMP domain-containing protein
MALDGQTQLLAFKSQDEFAKTYVTQDPASCTYYEMRVYHFGAANNKGKKILWRNCQKWRRSRRYIKLWQRDGRTFMLFHSKAVSFQEETYILGSDHVAYEIRGFRQDSRDNGIRPVDSPSADIDDLAIFPDIPGCEAQWRKEPRQNWLRSYAEVLSASIPDDISSAKSLEPSDEASSLSEWWKSHGDLERSLDDMGSAATKTSPRDLVECEVPLQAEDEANALLLPDKSPEAHHSQQNLEPNTQESHDRDEIVLPAPPEPENIVTDPVTEPTRRAKDELEELRQQFNELCDRATTDGDESVHPAPPEPENIVTDPVAELTRRAKDELEELRQQFNELRDRVTTVSRYASAQIRLFSSDNIPGRRTASCPPSGKSGDVCEPQNGQNTEKSRKEKLREKYRDRRRLKRQKERRRKVSAGKTPYEP